MMNYPLINILVRTSNRPECFARCYTSIRRQTYKNVRVIVSFDNSLTFDYVRFYPVESLVRCEPPKEKGMREVILPDGRHRKPFPANSYFNKMMEYTHPGYVLFLDDDNSFSTDSSLERIVARIENTNQLLFWRVQFPGFIIPNSYHYGKAPQPCHIDTSGFAFHTDYKKFAFWDSYTYGDYMVAHSLFKNIPQKVYINEVLTRLQGVPGHGKQTDIPELNLQEHGI